MPSLSAAQLILWRNTSGSANFPFPSANDSIPSVPGGAWQLLEAATAHVAPPSQAPADYWTRNVTGLNVQVSNANGTNSTVYLGYVTLFNAATGAERVLDDFSSVDYTWGTVVRDETLPRGRFAMALSFPEGSSNSTRPPSALHPMPGLFDSRVWTHIRLYWRLDVAPVGHVTSSSFGVGFGHMINVESVPPGGFINAGSTFDFIRDGIGPGAPYPTPRNSTFMAVGVAAPNFIPALAGAAATRNLETGDAVGALSLSSYFSSGVVWNRTFIALAEGPLVIIDAVSAVPGDQAQEWLAGPS